MRTWSASSRTMPSFKQGFGGEFTEFVGEADLVLSPVIYWAVEHGTSVFKDVRKAVYLIRNRDKK